MAQFTKTEDGAFYASAHADAQTGFGHKAETVWVAKPYGSKDWSVAESPDKYSVSSETLRGTEYKFTNLRDAKGFAALLVKEGHADYWEYRKQCADNAEKRFYAKRPEQLANLKKMGIAPQWAQ